MGYGPWVPERRRSIRVWLVGLAVIGLPPAEFEEVDGSGVGGCVLVGSLSLVLFGLFLELYRERLCPQP